MKQVKLAAILVLALSFASAGTAAPSWTDDIVALEGDASIVSTGVELNPASSGTDGAAIFPEKNLTDDGLTIDGSFYIDTDNGDAVIIQLFGNYTGSTQLDDSLNVVYDHYNDEVRFQYGGNTIASTSQSIGWKDHTFQVDVSRNSIFATLDGSPVLSSSISEGSDYNLSGENHLAVRGWSGAAAALHRLEDWSVSESSSTPEVWIDGFERTNPLDDYQGDTAEFGIVNSPVYGGSNAVKKINDQSDATILNSSSSVSQGSTIKTKIRYTVDADGLSPFHGAGTVFGAQDTSNYYLLGLINRDSTSDDSLVLYVKSGGGFNNVEQTTFNYQELQTGNWYEVNIDWDTDGNIAATAYDDAGNSISSLTYTDNSYTSGMVGVRSNLAGPVWDAPDFNKEPNASFTTDSPVEKNEDFGLNASGSSDPDGDTLSYYWDTDDDGNFNDSTGLAPSVSRSSFGDYSINLTVSDGEKNDSTAKTVSVEDLTDPSVDTAEPTGNITVRDTKANATFSDNIELQNYTFSLDGTQEDTGTLSSTSDSATVQLNDLAYGSHTFEWTVEDSFANTDTRSDTFTVVDDQPPTINSADATDQTNANLIVTGGDSVKLEANVTEESGATVQNVSAGIFGQNYTLTDGDDDNIFDATVTVPTGLSDGFKDLEIQAEDDSGNRDSQVFQDVIEVDTTPPSIENIWTPDTAAQLETFNVTAKIVEDRTSVIDPNVSVFGTSTSLSPANGDNYTAEITVDYDQTLGNYTATVEAEDVEGNTQTNNSDEIEVTETLPEINITEPKDGESIYGDSVYVEYIVDYPDQYTANTNVTVNGTTKTGNSTFQVLGEGTYVVTAKAETTDGRLVEENQSFTVGKKWTEIDTDQDRNAFIESGQRVIRYNSDLTFEWSTKLNEEVEEVEATSNYVAAWLPATEQLVKLRKDNGSVVKYYDRSGSNDDLYTMRSDGDRLYVVGRELFNAYVEEEDWSEWATRGQAWTMTGTFTDQLDDAGYPAFSMDIIAEDRVWIAGKNANQGGDIYLLRMTNTDGDSTWDVDLFDRTSSSAGTPRHLENFVRDTSMLISTDQGNMLNYETGTITNIPQPDAPKRMQSLAGHIFVEDGGVVDTYNYTGDYSNMPVENTFSFTGETVSDFERNGEKLTFITSENGIYREQSLNISELDINIESFTSDQDNYKRTERGNLTLEIEGVGLVDKIEIDGETPDKLSVNKYREEFIASGEGQKTRTAKIYANGNLIDQSSLTYDVRNLPTPKLYEPEKEEGFKDLPKIVKHKFSVDEGPEYEVDWRLELNGNVVERGTAQSGDNNYTVDYEYQEADDQRNKWTVVTEWSSGTIETEEQAEPQYYTTGKPSIIAGGLLSDVIQTIGNNLGLGFFGAAILLNLLISVLIAVGIMSATGSLGYATIGSLGSFIALGMFGFLPSWVSVAIGAVMALAAAYYIYKLIMGAGTE